MVVEVLAGFQAGHTLTVPHQSGLQPPELVRVLVVVGVTCLMVVVVMVEQVQGCQCVMCVLVPSVLVQLVFV